MDEKLISYIFSNYGKYIKSNPISSLYLKKIFKMIQEAYKETKSLTFDLQTTPVNNVNDMIYPTSFGGKYIHDNIKNYIPKNCLQYHKVNSFIGGRNVDIHFFDFEPSNKDELKRNVFLMFMWIHIVNKYSLKKCAETIKIYIYLTPFKKELPTNRGSVIDVINVNTGYTTSCSKNAEMVLYRKEEWMKVFYHETFHMFGLDFSGSPSQEYKEKLKRIFNIECDFLLFESYCEFWARIFNISFISFMLCDSKKYGEFEKYVNILLTLENLFSVFQFKKILTFMGLEYNHLYSHDEREKQACKTLYKENTNVFAYYVITSLMLNNINQTLEFFEKNNYSLLRFHEDKDIINKFVDFVDNIKDTRSVLELLKEPLNMKSKSVKNTMRMTLFHDF